MGSGIRHRVLTALLGRVRGVGAVTDSLLGGVRQLGKVSMVGLLVLVLVVACLAPMRVLKGEADRQAWLLSIPGFVFWSVAVWQLTGVLG